MLAERDRLPSMVSECTWRLHGWLCVPRTPRPSSRRPTAPATRHASGPSSPTQTRQDAHSRPWCDYSTLACTRNATASQQKNREQSDEQLKLQPRAILLDICIGCSAGQSRPCSECVGCQAELHKGANAGGGCHGHPEICKGAAAWRPPLEIALHY